jgi:hypothetical protein
MNATDSVAQGTDAALVGGIVGGVVALLLVGGLIALFAARRRRHGNGDPNKNSNMPNSDKQNAGVALHTSNYESLALRENSYGAIVLSPPQNYVEWSNKDDNYAKPSPAKGTAYEDFMNEF